ncbi:cell division initiation protein [Microbacterium sp. RG1]|uniref:cell division initiation protein n=1 Tax=Microbacterium sp. RG1 TaxID=2489212 RepID=UPI0010CA407E|nr:cell division initiation protein [Microbacterium sp. RG1]QCQ17938.1 cell division initiation protein [Microbacterium sp. RG1]
MTDARPDSPDDSQAGSSPFDELMRPSPGDEGNTFSVGFRGYDRHEVDTAISELTNRLQRTTAELGTAEARQRDTLDRLREEQQAEIERLVAETEASVNRVREEQREQATRLEADLQTATAQISEAEARIAALTAQLVERPDGDEGADPQAPADPSTRDQFEAVLRVAEEQASLIVQNAAAQAERLLEAAREEVATQRAQAQADISRIQAQAQHDADQVRLRIDTEYTAHEATIQREAAHAAEKLAQAEREAETIRSEAEKGAAALRAMVTRETAQLRSDTERDVREMNARLLEFEETLTRRQDDAQQEFLVLHNQAVAHAERITSDANDQVAASLEHAQRISAKADDYERLMRAQAAQIEADAHVRAQENLDRARTKAHKIVSTVIDHSTAVLRDAEDRTRALRWQQQQLTSFMSEVRELIRPEGVLTAAVGADEATAESDHGDGDGDPEQENEHA